MKTVQDVLELLDHHLTIPEQFCAEHAEDIDYQLHDSLFPLPFCTACGISKQVILINNLPYVIKIPFTGIFNEDNYYDAMQVWEEERDTAYQRALEEKQKIEGPYAILSLKESDAIYDQFKATMPCDDIEKWIVPFEYADIINDEDTLESMWDYCACEVSLYNAAAKAGLGTYFAKEEYVGTISNGYPVYMQQRCTPICDMEIDYQSRQYQEKSKKGTEISDKLNTDCFNAMWIADFVKEYGENEFKKLMSFVDEMDIGDLRDTNIGYYKKKPILIDYSNFRD